MNATEFNAKFADFPDEQLQPRKPYEGPTGNYNGPLTFPKFKRSEYAVSEVVCSKGEFCVGKTADGTFVALWHSHVYLAQDAAELAGVCNAKERELLPQ